MGHFCGVPVTPRKRLPLITFVLALGFLHDWSSLRTELGLLSVKIWNPVEWPAEDLGLKMWTC